MDDLYVVVGANTTDGENFSMEYQMDLNISAEGKL